ncbi:MAG: AcrR family transcriptional regulator [Candidatus Azotimanducaceae bacterium]|jgi:AcrR family transcriptional regulator
MARKYFMHAKRIELQKLARELGISRATAYRWAGSADQLAGEVLASLTNDTFKQLLVESKEKNGRERILEVLNKGMQYAQNFPALQRFLKRNPETGLKIVASKEGPVQSATILNIQGLLEDEVESGHLTLTVEPAVMAYALTRIIESFLYADAIAGTEPDLDNAAKILELMLSQN